MLSPYLDIISPYLDIISPYLDIISPYLDIISPYLDIISPYWDSDSVSHFAEIVYLNSLTTIREKKKKRQTLLFYSD